MGAVIRKRAAASDIADDLRESYHRAVARQGKWQTLADEVLAPALMLVDTVGHQLADARATALPGDAPDRVELVK